MKLLNISCVSIFALTSVAIASDIDVEAECEKAVASGETTGDCSCIADLAESDDDLMAAIIEAVADEAPLDDDEDSKLDVCR